MTAEHDEATATTADREIVLTRVFDAPRDLVFKVWTDPQHITHWWGPRGFTTTIHEMDVRPGGVWRFIMHGPDGVDYPNRITYTEVVSPELLAYHHDSDGQDLGPDFQVRATFEELDGKTHVTMRSVFATAEARDYVVEKVGAIEGGNQTLDRLGEYVAQMAEQSAGTQA